MNVPSSRWGIILPRKFGLRGPVLNAWKNNLKPRSILKCVGRAVLFAEFTFTTLLCLVSKRKYLESVSNCHKLPRGCCYRAWHDEPTMSVSCFGKHCRQGMDNFEIRYVLAPTAYLIQSSSAGRIIFRTGFWAFSRLSMILTCPRRSIPRSFRPAVPLVTPLEILALTLSHRGFAHFVQAWALPPRMPKPATVVGHSCR